MSRSNVTEVVVGKWPAILNALGVDKRYLVNRHGPCPLCEGGTDRFRFDDKAGKGSWFCNQCGAGDGWSLVMKLKGWDFKRAAREVEPLAGVAQPIAIRNGPDEAVIRQEMNDIWKRGKPIDFVHATQMWWANRIGAVPDCADLRGLEALACPNMGMFAAMVALVRDAEGKPVNLHRTFLTRLGEKADIESPRRVMPLPMPKGCAVRLAEPTDQIGIAEGIETAVAAQVCFGVPTWAAINAGNLKEWLPPCPDLSVVIFGEHDRSFTGQASSFELARRLTVKKFKVEVRIPGLSFDPTNLGDDWNDVLLKRSAA